MQLICSQRGITSFPTTELWRRKTREVVSSYELEAKLLSYGVASAAKPFKAQGRSANRISDQGSGKPSATAVDDIDFTGGAGGRSFGETTDRGTTGRFQNFGDGSNAKKGPKKPGDYGYKPGDNKEWLDNL